MYCPLHLLGTGNPLSIIAYAMAGADSFDGLEWCQTVVDHETGKLFHFQQWDLFCHQTEWGQNNALPYIQSVLMHNLDFYARFMADLHDAVRDDGAIEFLRQFATEDQVALLLHAISDCLKSVARTNLKRSMVERSYTIQQIDHVLTG